MAQEMPLAAYEAAKNVELYDQRMRDAHEPPLTDDDLFHWIWAYCGLKIPRVAVCEGHQAPFEGVADAFFERVLNQVWLASRASGKTLNLSVLYHSNLMFKLGYEIASVGAITAQAEKCYNYLRRYTETEWFYTDRLSSNMKKTVYKKGGSAEILSGTMEGVNAPHPRQLGVDEVDLLAWKILQQAFSMPISGGGFRASTILTSTRKFRARTMQRLVDMIANDSSCPFALYTWCVFEIVSQCTEESCENCQRKILRDRDGEIESFYEICQGKAKRSNGFMLLRDVWEKFMLMDWDVFDAEWLGTRPGRVGRVFKGFHEDIHARRFPIDLDMFKQTIVVLDDGWTDPTAVLFIGRDSHDNLFCFDCMYRSVWPREEVAKALKEKFDLYGWSIVGTNQQTNEIKLYGEGAKWIKLYDKEGNQVTLQTLLDEEDNRIKLYDKEGNDIELYDKGGKKIKAYSKKVLYVDTRAPRAIHVYRGLGFEARAIGAPVDEGNRFIRTMLTNRRKRTGHLELLIHPDTCGPLIDEMVSLSYPTDKDGAVTTEKYKGADHLIDDLRYGGAVFGLIEGDNQPVRTAIEVARPEVAVPTHDHWRRTVRLRAQQQRKSWRNTRLPARYRRR